jgi:hypothetical protein
MEILLALAAAVSYGVSDFAGGVLTRRAPVFVVFLLPSSSASPCCWWSWRCEGTPSRGRGWAGGRRPAWPVMGHEATSRLGQQRGSAMGAHYRHTTPEMAARIATAIEQRLRLVLEVAERALEGRPSRSTQRVLATTGRVFWQISGKWRSEREWKMRCAWWS